MMPELPEEPVPTQPNPVMQLLIEYRRVAEALYQELGRHERDHGCSDGIRLACDLDRALLRLWGDTREMAEALDWLVLGDLPLNYFGRPTAAWVYEYMPGPWPAPRPGWTIPAPPWEEASP